MEFLAKITLRSVENLDSELQERKRVRAHIAKLITQDHPQRMWSLPALFEDRATWCAKDTTQLHETATSFPAYPRTINGNQHPPVLHAVDPTTCYA